MKGTIDYEGILHVTPESDTEAWALRKWWEGFNPSMPNASTGISVHHKEFAGDHRLVRETDADA